MSDGRIALDIHAHLAPVFPDDLHAVEGVTWDADAQVMTIDGHPVGMKPLFDPSALVQWMDRNNIAQALISIPPPLYRPQLQATAARAWTDYANRGLQRIADDFPERLLPLPHLPLQSPQISADVARDWIGRGHRRFGAPAGGNGEQVLSDRAYERLWQILDKARAFVFFHPGECADGRLSAFYLSNLLGNPYETAVAIGHLTFGGVIERHPGITFGFAHGGGAAPMLAGRFERGFATVRPGINTKTQPPHRAFRNICVDCIVHDENALTLAEQVFGADNILFGSDWPFPMGLPEPHTQLASLAPQQRRRIFCDNPERLLGKTGQTREEHDQ
jgi:aminocarboxymuconate-semialdehyde decarboxylase